MKEQQPDTST